MRSLRVLSLITISLLTILLSAILRVQSSSSITDAVIKAPLVKQSAAVKDVSQPDPATQAKIRDGYGKLPLSFEANQGQADSQVKFLTRTGAYSMFLTGDEAVLVLRERKDKKDRDKDKFSVETRLAATPAKANSAPTPDLATQSVLRMKLRNANPAAKITGTDELAGTSNYFIGNDPAKWRTNVPTYSKVKYEGIYSGIDLIFYGNQRQLEYDFIVAPGANPREIAFDFSGARRIRQDEQGGLVLMTSAGEIRWQKPVVYQEKDGARQEIAAHYSITRKNRVSFELAKYDASRTLYIDPLIYSTYLGGSGDEIGVAITVDSAGNAYLAGYTSSTDFPTMNPLQSANGGGGGGDVFVTKINAAGSALVYSTYLGGSGVEYGRGIAVDRAGNAYVAGWTSSTNFPTMNPLQSANAGTDDAFVTKINSTGSALVYSTYLGGSGHDAASGIAVDSAGNAYLAGYTSSSTNFPTMNPLQSANAGSYDAFVTKINSTGSALVYSTYLGGIGDDYSSGVAVDHAGNAYLTGWTSSTNFPTKKPLQPANAGGYDAFVAKINPTGSALVYSTYYGGPQEEFGNGIATDAGGNAYIAGGEYTNICNPYACLYYDFVVKLNPTGSALIYKAGGTLAYRAAQGIVVDSAGSAYVLGVSHDNGANLDRTYVEKFDPSGLLVGSPAGLGGNAGAVGYGIATDGLGNAYVTGETQSTNFPTKKPLQPANAGGYDAFVSKIDMRIVTATTLTASPNPSTLGQAVTLTAIVSSKFGTPPNGETISFVKGKTVLGTGTLSGGTATFTTSSLPMGTNLIQAVYGGDAKFGGSKSKTVSQVVN